MPSAWAESLSYRGGKEGQKMRVGQTRLLIVCWGLKRRSTAILKVREFYACLLDRQVMKIHIFCAFGKFTVLSESTICANTFTGLQRADECQWDTEKMYHSGIAQNLPSAASDTQWFCGSLAPFLIISNKCERRLCIKKTIDLAIHII